MLILANLVSFWHITVSCFYYYEWMYHLPLRDTSTASSHGPAALRLATADTEVHPYSLDLHSCRPSSLRIPLTSIDAESDRLSACICSFHHSVSHPSRVLIPPQRYSRDGSFASVGNCALAHVSPGACSPVTLDLRLKFYHPLLSLDRGQLRTGLRTGEPPRHRARFEFPPSLSRPETNSAIYSGPSFGSGCSRLFAVVPGGRKWSC